MMRILLVDDEAAANRRVRALLAEFPGIEVIGAVGSVAEAREFLQGQLPDIVFLDMEMQGERGLDLLPFLEPSVKVVFCTGHEEYAVQAFVVGAVDYLLKPVARQRLELALQRLGAAQDAIHPTKEPEKVMLPSVKERSVEWVETGTIAWIEALQNYTQVRLQGGRGVLFKKTMSAWLEELPEERFKRLDRSLIVQLGLLRSVQWQSRDRSLLHFDGVDEPLAIGRVAATRLKELLPRI